MSVLTRKQQVNGNAGLRAQAAYAARQFGPYASKSMPVAQQAAQQAALQAQAAAQQAVPLARTAGASMRQGADGAMAWATPKIDAARAWAAPQLEQSAHALTDSLAPTISTALINAAHKIDAPVRKKPRRRGGLIAGIVMLVAAACGAAVVAFRLRQQPVEVTSVTIAEDDGPPDPDMNGHSQIV